MGAISTVIKAGWNHWMYRGPPQLVLLKVPHLRHGLPAPGFLIMIGECFWASAWHEENQSVRNSDSTPAQLTVPSHLDKGNLPLDIAVLWNFLLIWCIASSREILEARPWKRGAPAWMLRLTPWPVSWLILNPALRTSHGHHRLVLPSNVTPSGQPPTL